LTDEHRLIDVVPHGEILQTRCNQFVRTATPDVGHDQDFQLMSAKRGLGADTRKIGGRNERAKLGGDLGFVVATQRTYLRIDKHLSLL
jgi:hypothetical protein